MLTKHSGDPATHGCNFNHIESSYLAGYGYIGLNIDYGEGNVLTAVTTSTSMDGTLGYRIADAITTIVGCSADSTMGPRRAAPLLVDQWGFPTGALENGNTGFYFTEKAGGSVLITPSADGCFKRIDFQSQLARDSVKVIRHRFG